MQMQTFLSVAAYSSHSGRIPAASFYMNAGDHNSQFFTPDVPRYVDRPASLVFTIPDNKYNSFSSPLPTKSPFYLKVDDDTRNAVSSDLDDGR